MFCIMCACSFVYNWQGVIYWCYQPLQKIALRSEPHVPTSVPACQAAGSNLLVTIHRSLSAYNRCMIYDGHHKQLRPRSNCLQMTTYRSSLLAYCLSQQQCLL